jgi:hypothetical protein
LGVFGRSYSVATKEGLAKGIQEHFFRNLLDCMLQLADNQRAMEIVQIESKEHRESTLRKAHYATIHAGWFNSSSA